MVVDDVVVAAATLGCGPSSPHATRVMLPTVSNAPTMERVVRRLMAIDHTVGAIDLFVERLELDPGGLGQASQQSDDRQRSGAERQERPSVADPVDEHPGALEADDAAQHCCDGHETRTGATTSGREQLGSEDAECRSGGGPEDRSHHRPRPHRPSAPGEHGGVGEGQSSQADRGDEMSTPTVGGPTPTMIPMPPQVLVSNRNAVILPPLK